MLSPVNTVELDTTQWGSLAEEWVKEVNKTTQLTPWRKGSWLLWNGLLKETAREIQNPLWRTESRAGHKAEDRRYFYLMYLWNQNTLHAWNVTNRCSYFPNQSREACGVFFFLLSAILSTKWALWDLNLVLVSIHDAFTPTFDLFTLIKLINEEHAGKPPSTGGVNGVPMLSDQQGTGRGTCDIFCASYLILSLQCL